MIPCYFDILSDCFDILSDYFVILSGAKDLTSDIKEEKR